MVKLTNFKQCQNLFSEGSAGLKANAGAYINNRDMNGATKTIWIKADGAFEGLLEYSLMLRNNSFCLSLQCPLTLAIHAIFFPSSLSGIFTELGGKQIWGRIIPSPSTGDRRRLGPGGIGSKQEFGSQDTV